MLALNESKPLPIDTLIHARWIIPVEPDGQVYEHHALAINGGKIVGILPAGEADRYYHADVVRRLDSHALIPGMINVHTHAAMNLLRGFADDLPLMDWLQHHIWPAEQQWVSPAFVRDGTRLAIAEMLRGGTTCFNDMYFFPDQVAQVAIDSGIRASVGLIVIEFPSAWATDADDYLRKGLAVHDQLRGHDRVQTAFAPHAPYTVGDDALRRIVTYAGELNLPIAMHVHETAGEVARTVKETGERPLKRLERLGLLSPQFLAIHMTQLEAYEISTLAAQGASVLHCPESNLKLASGFCPVAALLKAGVNVAIGTDGAASNNDLDMFGEMRTAALLAKAVAGDASAVPAHEALRMATLNGARALGLDAVTGSLIIGKEADVVAVDLGGLESQPVYDPVSQIVYACSRNQVTDVWVQGKSLLADRQLLTLDEQAIAANTAAWHDRIRTTVLK